MDDLQLKWFVLNCRFFKVCKYITVTVNWWLVKYCIYYTYNSTKDIQSIDLSFWMVLFIKPSIILYYWKVNLKEKNHTFHLAFFCVWFTWYKLSSCETLNHWLYLCAGHFLSVNISVQIWVMFDHSFVSSWIF